MLGIALKNSSSHSSIINVESNNQMSGSTLQIAGIIKMLLGTVVKSKSLFSSNSINISFFKKNLSKSFEVSNL